ncbi:MAG TPA: cytochrome c biogenesis protein CcdA, partial [Bryobacteraceae bacterium]|nr:cytochrome c biogenesis protein CcdA [Bryobacteraceae bacterium]
MALISRLLALLTLVACAPNAFSQRLNPVKWKLEFEPSAAAPGAAVLGRLTATIEGEWHLYSMTTPKGGPIITTIALAEKPVVESWRIYQPRPERRLDPNFGIDTETFAKEVVFLFEVRIAANATAGAAELTANTRYQVCTDRECLPPRRVPVPGTLKIDAAAKSAPPVIPAGYSEVKAASPSSPSTAPPRTAGSARSAAPGGLGPFLAVAFGFGVAAIFTPCVFPMIPITLSFFLSAGERSRGAAIRQAAIFCLGIVVLFTAIGFAVTVILGPFGAVQLGSNIWVNLFIAAVFFVFGLSLLGAFEITLPSGLLTRLDAASRGTGTLPTLTMGLTFSLTAFACVGPFIGTLLAASVQGDKLQPLLGMGAFAAGLASPFFLLALFPSLLPRLPRSGGWMVRIKVVFGFIVIAAMLKYLSSVDQVLQWNVLTRERFLAIWFVLFALPGLYLLGFLRMEGIRRDESVGIAPLLVGTALLSFALSLLPGMFGSRLGELDAFVPLSSQSTLTAGASGETVGLTFLRNRYHEGLAKARAENKLLFVSFTGYACTNCHWMKANMFPRPEIVAALKEMVLVELYTDGTDRESEQNQKLQE